MTSYQRTQVYLDPDEHRRLRQIAADRGVSMTTVVREAVGRYLTDQVAPHEPTETPWWQERLATLGIPDGPAGFAASLEALGRMPPPRDHRRRSPTPDDDEIGAHLYEEYRRHADDHHKRDLG